jgi:hypothetical protein
MVSVMNHGGQARWPACRGFALLVGKAGRHGGLPLPTVRGTAVSRLEYVVLRAFHFAKVRRLGLNQEREPEVTVVLRDEDRSA